MVFDRYLPNSIKGVTRAKQKTGKSKGIRRDVASREQRIGNWDRFIVIEESKASLAHFLSTEMSQRYGTHPGRERNWDEAPNGVVVVFVAPTLPCRCTI